MIERLGPDEGKDSLSIDLARDVSTQEPLPESSAQGWSGPLATSPQPDVTLAGGDTATRVRAMPQPADLAAVLEAILLVADEAVPAGVLARAVDQPTEPVEQALAAMARRLDERTSGFELREVAGGWRFYTRPAYAPWVERFVRDGQQARLTQAALETLAVVAYRQPITRARVSAVRGVNVDGVVRTLLGRGLLTEVGADPQTSGTLYGTTPLLLEKLGLRSLEQLPSLAPLLPELEDIEEGSMST